jgi:shikimate kinase
MGHIFLTGYRCTGKTSVGRKLASDRNLPFYDTDTQLVNRTGKTIQEWVEEKGWASFRLAEKSVIQEISSWTDGVVALGGGAVLDLDNREIIKKNGVIVWLTADVTTILERMKADPKNKDQRPPLSERDWETETRETLAVRTPVYQALADLQIDTEGKTVEDIVVEIETKMRLQRS